MSQTISPLDVLTSSNQHPDREKSDECTTDVRIKAADTAERVSKLLDCLGTSARVSSGFRTGSANSKAGGAKLSAHLTGEAVDLEDPEQVIGRTLNAKPELLAQFDLYMENIYYTPTWCHLQTRPTASGRRIFTP